MFPLLGPGNLQDTSIRVACKIASPPENTANLLGPSPLNSQARRAGGQTKEGVTVSWAELADGSSHSCPELQGYTGGLGFKGQGLRALMASAFFLLDDVRIQFKG